MDASAQPTSLLAGSPLLAGKRVLVTGGGRGIGSAVVRRAADEGADVAFTYRSSDAQAFVLKEQVCGENPGRSCFPLQADVADAEAMEEVAAAVMEDLGGIDVLVNNAGITRDVAFARARRQDWDEVFDTNLGGMFNTTRPLVLPLVKQRSGSIVNMSSAVGLHGNAGQAPYAASKAGVIGFTKSLAKELAGFDVTVNAIAPGMIETDMLGDVPAQKLEYIKAMIPAQRFGTADEVAWLVCFLASDRARYITGQVIEVSGGLML
ncbi:MAG: 3-oxoacyl-ACP reductase FabG [Gaiellaceae bacterium]